MSDSPTWDKPQLNESILAPIACRVLGEENARLVSWRSEELYGIGGGLYGSRLYRISGKAESRGCSRPWSGILKIIKVSANDQPTDAYYWKREIEVYGSGLLDELPEGLSSPVCYGVEDRGESWWIWLEEVEGKPGKSWPLSRYGLAARHFGRLNGTYLVERQLPDVP